MTMINLYYFCILFDRAFAILPSYSWIGCIAPCSAWTISITFWISTVIFSTGRVSRSVIRPMRFIWCPCLTENSATRHRYRSFIISWQISIPVISAPYSKWNMSDIISQCSRTTGSAKNSGATRELIPKIYSFPGARVAPGFLAAPVVLEHCVYVST